MPEDTRYPTPILTGHLFQRHSYLGPWIGYTGLMGKDNTVKNCNSCTVGMNTRWIEKVDMILSFIHTATSPSLLLYSFFSVPSSCCDSSTSMRCKLLDESAVLPRYVLPVKCTCYWLYSVHYLVHSFFSCLFNVLAFIQVLFSCTWLENPLQMHRTSLVSHSMSNFSLFTLQSPFSLSSDWRIYITIL